MLKSKPDRYGVIAVSNHRLTVILILALLDSGFRAANAIDAIAKAGALRFHIPMASIVLLLTALRIAWWWPIGSRCRGPAGKSISRAGLTSPSTSSFSAGSPAASG